MVFKAVFNSILIIYYYITAVSAPIHAFPDFFQPVLRAIFFPSHWLFSHITIVETTERGDRGRNPVDYHEFSERIFAEPGIDLLSQVRNATDEAMGLGAIIIYLYWAQQKFRACLGSG